MDVAKFSVTRPVATWMRILIFVMLGGIAFFQLPVELLPDVSKPALYVVTNWAGVSPEDMEAQITQILENAVSTVPGLLYLASTTTEGSSQLNVQFSPGQDMSSAALNVLQLIQGAQKLLPQGDPTLTAPAIQQYNPNNQPVLVLGVSGINDPVQLGSLLTYNISPMLQATEGVASAGAAGGLPRAVMVQIDPQSLLAHSFSSQDVVQAITNENQNVPGGTVINGNQQQNVLSYGWVQSMAELRSIPVGAANGRMVSLSEVAKVSDSHSDPTNYQRLNGVPSGSLNVLKQDSANTVTAVNNALAQVQTINKSYPQLQFRQVYNQSAYVLRSVDSLEEAALLGGGLAMLVVFFFLRNFRSTLVVATSIPVSVISTFAFIYLIGYTLNTMSLVGLALATGLIVDDAVVVLENIYRVIEEEGRAPAEAAVEGTRSITSAVISSTLTIMVVFFPLLLIPGQTGQMFKPFALVVITCMAFSLLDALTGVPMLCSQFIKVEKDPKPGFWTKTFAIWERWTNSLQAGYTEWLGAAIRLRWWVLLGGLGLLAASLILLPFIGVDFMPASDTGTLRLQMQMPTGTSLDQTDQAMRQVEKVIAADPDVVTYQVSVGQGSGGTSSYNTGSGWIALSDSPKRASCDEVSARLMKGFNKIPGLRAFASTMDVVRTAMGVTQGQNLELDIFGPDQTQLAALSKQFLGILQDVPGLSDLRDSVGDPAPQVSWIVDRVKATSLGLTFGQISSAIQTASAGTTASYYNTSGQRIPIIVQLPLSQRQTTGDLLSLVVSSSVASKTTNATLGTNQNESQGVELSEVAQAKTTLGYNTILRLTGQGYRALVSAGQGQTFSDVQKAVSARLQGVKMPSGYTWDWSQTTKSQSQEMQKLAYAVLMAIVLIYMLLCIQFESLLVPLSIMLSVPLCLIGILLALFLSAHPFSIMAGVGCLMLVGIAVKNGILLIENTLQAREGGKTREDALLTACPARLRPILITASAAVLGMLPVAVRGRGGELEAPMGIVVVGGLIASTALTLFIVPLAYLAVDDIERRFFRPKEKPDA